LSTDQAKEPTRRGFLAAAAATLATLPFLGALVVALRTALAPAGADAPERFPLCRLDQVPEDDILERAIVFQMRRGPVVQSVSRVVFVTRDPDRPADVLAMSGECTHLTCPVQKKNVEKSPTGGGAPLQCPCHGGAFSRTGEVVDGPPPRPLRRLRIELPDDGEGMIHLLEL